MNKKILYVVAVIVVIIIFTIIWKGKKEEPLIVPTETQNPITQVNNENTVPVDTNEAINSDLDKVDLNSGIDNDLNSVDTDIKTL